MTIILMVSLFYLSDSFAAKISNSCNPEKLNEFKKLYIQLQQELNYEGKDAVLAKTKKYQLKLENHKKNKPYEGKIFEDILFKEFQNTLRKVGKLYQDSALLSQSGEVNESNRALIDFFKSIESAQQTDIEKLVKYDGLKKFISSMAAESKKRFGKKSDELKKFVLTEHDEYMLEKLLTHAQDRICTVKEFEETGKKTKYFPSVEYLNQLKNAPLNRLIKSLNDSGLTKDSEIKLVNTETAINSAITSQLTNLATWMKENNPQCGKIIRANSFKNTIQSNIQGCNYVRFLDSLAQANVDNLETVLHFINANEKFLNFGQAKAETNLDEIKLEGYISTAFNDIGKKVKCTSLTNKDDAADKKIFIRNLPYNMESNTFDHSDIQCFNGLKEISERECRSSYQLISDEFGRGLELKPKSAKKSIRFEMKNQNDCALVTQEPAPPVAPPTVPPPAQLEVATAKPAVPPEAKKPAAVTTSDKQIKCEEKNEEWIEKSNNGIPGIKYSWNSETENCDEMKSDKKDEGPSDDTLPNKDLLPIDFGTKAVPGRFVPQGPVNRPTTIIPGTI